MAIPARSPSRNAAKTARPTPILTRRTVSRSRAGALSRSARPVRSVDGEALAHREGAPGERRHVHPAEARGDAGAGGRPVERRSLERGRLRAAARREDDDDAPGSDGTVALLA